MNEDRTVSYLRGSFAVAFLILGPLSGCTQEPASVASTCPEVAEATAELIIEFFEQSDDAEWPTSGQDGPANNGEGGLLETMRSRVPENDELASEVDSLKEAEEELDCGPDGWAAQTIGEHLMDQMLHRAQHTDQPSPEEVRTRHMVGFLAGCLLQGECTIKW